MSQLPTSPRRRRAAVLLGVVPLVLLAGCSDDSSIEVAGDGATTTTAAEASTSTTTTVPEATTTTGARTESSLDSGDTPAAEEATDVTWALNVAGYRGRDGYRVGFDCPPGGTPSTVWGTGPFTDDSSVCTAAVYAGLVTLAGGGRVVAEIRPGEPSYDAGSANGIDAQSYGPWSGSFVFV